MKKELYPIEEVPEYVKDNPYVLTGYRSESYPLLKSLFGWHNETLNIWTHLLAAIFFIFVPHKNIPMLIFKVALVSLYLTSTFYHIYLCKSEKAYLYWKRADFFTIALFMFCAFIPFIAFVYIGSSRHIMLVFIILVFRSSHSRVCILHIGFMGIDIRFSCNVFLLEQRLYLYLYYMYIVIIIGARCSCHFLHVSMA